MTKAEFSKRYLKFWIIFHQGQKIPPEIQETILILYEKISPMKISFEKLDEILSTLELEVSAWPYSFNLAAYVNDWIVMERQDKAAKEREQELWKTHTPILLPREQTTVKGNNPKILEAMESLRRSGLTNWMTLLERINTKRKKYTEDIQGVCTACLGSGFVELKDGGSIGTVATCTCARGKKNRGTGERIPIGWTDTGRPLFLLEASPEQCRTAASRNIGDIPF